MQTIMPNWKEREWIRLLLYFKRAFRHAHRVDAHSKFVSVQSFNLAS